MSGESRPGVQLRDILFIVFKRKYKILFFFLATVGTVTIGSLLMEPTYEATAQILVKLGRGNILVSGVGNENPHVYLRQEQVINSEAEIINSDSLATKVILDLGGPDGIFPEPVNNKWSLKTMQKRAKDLLANHAPWVLRDSKNSMPSEQKEAVELKEALLKFRKSLTVESIRESNLIHLGFKHKDPVLAANALNKLAEIYIDHHLEIHKSNDSYNFFQSQADLLKKKLIEAEEKLDLLRSKYKISNYEEQRNILLRQKADLQSALNKTTSLETEASKSIAELRRQLKQTPETIPREQQDSYNEQLISRLQARLVELQIQEKELLAQYTDESRLVKNIREEVAMVSQKLTEHENKRYGRSTSGVNPLHQTVQQELMRYSTEQKALAAKRKTLVEQIEEYEKKLLYLNEVELEYNQLQRQVEADRRNYDLYLTKMEESRISDAMDTEKMSNVSLVEPAYPPLNPVSPKIALNLLLAVILGVFGGLWLAFFGHYVGDKIETPEDVERALKLPVLTSIPEHR